MTTERLYYTDCYLRDFEARVLQAEPGPQGLRVYLDHSAFYPESGGQPSDRGTLAGIPVLDVIDEGDQVAHVLGSKPGGEREPSARSPCAGSNLQKGTCASSLSAGAAPSGPRGATSSR